MEKQNCNQPKFKSGSTLYTIKDYSWISEEKDCVSVLFDGKYYYGFDITSEEDLTFYYGMEQLLVPEDELYATIEEAKEVLKKERK